MKSDIPKFFVPLEQETRAAVDTATAAHHYIRRPQTLRAWASSEDGPVRPIRINGRLAWLVSDIRRVVGRDPTNATKTKRQTDLLDAAVTNSIPDSKNSGELSCQE